MASTRKTMSATAIALLALVVFACLSYCFVVWSNCDSTLGTFASDFINFHTSEC